MADDASSELPYEPSIFGPDPLPVDDTPIIPLEPLPEQALRTAWPTKEWPEKKDAPDVDAGRLRRALDTAFKEQPDHLGTSLACVVIHRGELVAERYGPDTNGDSTLISWSVAKSMTHALCGLLVGDGLLEPDSPAEVPGWEGDDPRAAITLRQLLQMRPGLAWREEYVEAEQSDVIEMLWGSGADDMAAFAAGFELAHNPGAVLNYSSGTTNIVAGICGRAIGGGATGIEEYLRERLFAPLGMTSATIKCDAAGTWVGSSYAWATARDFARFGLLYLRDGVWEGVPLLPEGWVEDGRTPTGIDEEGDVFAHHWWADPGGLGVPSGFSARGYEGQYVRLIPTRNLIIVRLGKTPTEHKHDVWAWMDEVARCFPDGW